MKQFYEHCKGDKRDAKSWLQKFVDNKSKSDKTRGLLSYDSDDDSQVSLLQDIVQTDESTQYAEFLMAKTSERLATHLGEKNN